MEDKSVSLFTPAADVLEPYEKGYRGLPAMTRVRGVDPKGRRRDTESGGLGLHFKFMKGYERMYSGVSKRRCRENDEPRSKGRRGQGLSLH